MTKNLVSRRNLGPKFFSWILPLLILRHCCKVSLHAISRKTNEPNLRQETKKLVSRRNLGPKSFSWILPLLHVRHHWKLSLYAILTKTN